MRGVNYIMKRSFNNSECRGGIPSAGDLGYSPNSNAPKTGGYGGLKSVAERSLIYLNLGKKIVI